MARDSFKQLEQTMRTLRSESGCPWDRAQTLESLKPFLIEETYEVLDAIDSGHAEDHLEELGDLLFQIVFQSQIRSEQGDFCFDDVAAEINKKDAAKTSSCFWRPPLKTRTRSQKTGMRSNKPSAPINLIRVDSQESRKAHRRYSSSETW